MHLIKLPDGKYFPMDAEDHDASKKIKVGSIVKATQDRNYQFHKKGMALLNLGFENQDKYKTFEVYRKIVTIKAGYFDEVEGKDGHTYYLPKSLSYNKMNAETFEKWYNDTLDVISKDLNTKPDKIKQEIESFYN